MTRGRKAGVKIPAPLFVSACSAIWGKQWQTPASKVLEVPRMTLYRWARAGAPESVRDVLLQALHQRTQACVAVALSMET